MTSLDASSLETTERPSIALPVTAWVTNLVGLWPVGLVIAYLERGRAPPEIASQYQYLIRTVWIGALFFAVSCILYFVLVGPLVMLATCLWYLARCIKALLALSRGEPIRNPRTWLV